MKRKGCLHLPVDIATPAAIRDEMRSSIMKDVIII